MCVCVFVYVNTPIHRRCIYKRDFCICVYICVHMYMFIYIYVCVCEYMYIYVHITYISG